MKNSKKRNHFRGKTGKISLDKISTHFGRGLRNEKDFQVVNLDGNGATVADLAAYMGLAERTIRDRIKKMQPEFKLEKGVVRNTTLNAENVKK